MKIIKSRILMAIAAGLMLSGCAGKEVQSVTYTPAGTEPVKEESGVAGNSASKAPLPDDPASASAAPASGQPTGSRVTVEPEERAEYVGIAAHVKEIHEDSLLISSDTDDFPGAFTVVEFQDLVAEGEIPEGGFVYVLMEDLHETDEEGLPKYKAQRIVSVPKDETMAQPDILLTDAPVMSLTDALSSAYNPIEIQSGNYSWTVEENGEGKTLVACGAAPLEIARLHPDAKIKLPRYNKMDYVLYSFSTKVAPDILVVRQWDVPNTETRDEGTETAGADPMEEAITTYYYQNPFLHLEPGKVYEFSAEWKEENLEEKRFCGIASYVLVTE